MGLTCFLTILLYVKHEFSYDRFYPDYDRIYRVYQQQTGNVFLGTDYFALTPAQLASVMQEELPELAHATAVEKTAGLLASGEENTWQEGLAGDAGFFKVFKIQFLEGDPGTALADGQSIVLTRSLAEAIFGNQNPIGKPISYQDSEKAFFVTGVIADPPLNSSLKYSFVIHLLYNDFYAEEIKRTGWTNNSFHTFFELRPDADPDAVEDKLADLLQKYQSTDDFGDYPFKDKYYIQPLTASYFQSDVNFDLGQKGNLKAIYAYAAAALIVLLLACINYMNLAVARSVNRAREVGLRKVVGAARRQLIEQFLGESVLISLFALVLALGLCMAFLPYFGQIVDRPIEMEFLSDPWLLPGIVVLVLSVGLLSGGYPAFLLSSLKPMDIFKSKTAGKLSGISIQKLLIVFQFVASIVLIISSVVIYRQLDFVKNKELGFDKENVVTFLLKDRTLLSKIPTLVNEWKQDPGVLAATISTSLPSNITSSTLMKKTPGDTEQISVYQWTVGAEFMEVFGLNLLTGRTFGEGSTTDENESCILNESAVKALGYSVEDAIGQQIDAWGTKTIIGVVSDFHMLSMHLPIQPLMISHSNSRGRYISLKVQSENLSQTLASIKKVHNQHTVYPFEYGLLSEEYDRLYSSELKLGELFRYFTLVSILVASLGLFGMAALMAGQRTKEIGIRKVLGASGLQVILMLSWDFGMWILAAIAIAIPMGWYAMDSWLMDFAYKIDLSWWIFALAGLSALLIASCSIGFQSVRAALANPVESLRSE